MLCSALRKRGAQGSMSELEVEFHVNCESDVPAPCGLQRPMLNPGKSRIASVSQISFHFAAPSLSVARHFHQTTALSHLQATHL